MKLNVLLIAVGVAGCYTVASSRYEQQISVMEKHMSNGDISYLNSNDIWGHKWETISVSSNKVARQLVVQSTYRSKGVDCKDKSDDLFVTCHQFFEGNESISCAYTYTFTIGGQVHTGGVEIDK